MKFNVRLPFDHIEPAAEFQSAEALAEIAGLIDRLGFHGCRPT